VNLANPGRNCVRCGAKVYGRAGDQPHLCRDVEGRLKEYRHNRRQHLRRLIRNLFAQGW
jgi:hypothetical protein